MEALAFLHHSIVYEHPEDYELQLTWDDLKTIPKTILPEIVFSGNPFSGQISPQTASLLCLIGGLAVIAAADPASATTLSRGSSGSEVRQLQYALNQAGYFNGPFTGFYGSLTQNAVKNFQAARGLTVDGVAGHRTLSALQAASAPVGGGNLKYGMYGSDVLDLQYSLSSTGYFKGPFTGYFGELTEAAVVALQRDFGLSPDGIVGPSTRAALSGAAAPASSQASTGGSQSLRYGSTGPAVNQLQRDLANAGYYSGPFTEYFGSLTQSAVRNFQAARGLSQDGIAGPNTQTSLAQALAGAAPASVPPVAVAPTPPQPSPEPQATPNPTPVATAEPIPEPTSAPEQTPTQTPAPESTATQTPTPTQTPTATATPQPSPTSTVSEATPDQGPVPVGFIELQSDVQAYDAPNGKPIESSYPLYAGQILGYAEDKGDGWIRIVGAGNGDDAWIYAGDNYSSVEFRNSSQANSSPSASPDLSLNQSPSPSATNPAPQATSTVVPATPVSANDSFFIGPTAVEVEQALNTYDAPNGNAQNVSLSPGTKLNYIAATPSCWVLLQDDAGKSSWVFAGESFNSLKFLSSPDSNIEVSSPSCTPAN